MVYVASTRIEFIRSGQAGFSGTYFGKAGETLADLIYLLGANVIITKCEILGNGAIRV